VNINDKQRSETGHQYTLEYKPTKQIGPPEPQQDNKQTGHRRVISGN